MDKKTIETLSINAVRDSIVMTDFLDQFIADNDKEPSWDGSVYIYNNKNKIKENLKGRIPVQVKGTENDDLSKEIISFPVSVIDLNNYLYDGGVVFFVVYIGYKGLTKQIYYAELPPVKIRNILSEANVQKTKNIKLKKFPTDPNEKAMVFFNCLENCQRQSSFSIAKLHSLEELEEQGVLESLTIPLTTVGNISPITALFKNEFYVYANIKGGVIPQPLDIRPQNLVIGQERKIAVTVGNRKFYNRANIFQDANTVKMILGESFSMTVQKSDRSSRIHYKNSNKLRTLVNDLDFILSCISQGEFQINGKKIPFDKETVDLSNFQITKKREFLEYAKKIVQMLDMFGCKKDIDITTLSKQDWQNINYLVTAFVDKKEVSGLKENLPCILLMPIGTLKFAVYLQKVEGSKGTYKMFDFFKTDLKVAYDNSNGDKLPISQYAILKANDFISVDNIRFDVLLPSFQKVKRHSETISKANCFLLDLLEAYDRSKERIEIINTARDFSDWIMAATEEELPYDIRLLNKLQIEKRLRPLNIDEVKKLFRIVESPNTREEILVGAYLLLDEQAAAEIHFEKLDKPIQEEFKKYPIYHFWKQG